MRHLWCTLGALSAFPLTAWAQDVVQAMDPSVAQIADSLVAVPGLGVGLAVGWFAWGQKASAKASEDRAAIRDLISEHKSEIRGRIDDLAGELRQYARAVVAIEERQESLDAIARQFPQMAEDVRRVAAEVHRLAQDADAWTPDRRA